MTNKNKIIIAISSGILAAFGVIVFMLFMRKMEKLPENASFSNVNLSEMTHDEVQEVADSKINKIFEKEKIKLEFAGQVYNLNPKDIDAHFDAEDIFKYAKKEDEKTDENKPKVKYDKKKLEKFIEELKNKTIIQPKKYAFKKVKAEILIKEGINGKELDVEKTLNIIDKSLEELDFKVIKAPFKEITSENSKINLNEIKKQVDTKVKDAEFKLVNGKRTFTDEVVGTTLDLEKARKIIAKTPTGKIAKIPLDITKPTKTVAALKSEISNPKTPHVLASFTTSFPKGTDRLSKNRNQNIRIAASAINGIVLLPGEEFSFGATAGAAKGYLEAVTYENGKKTTGIGGGMCQVSSTLFNSVLKAGLKITQRQSHSKPAGYVRPGLDATYDSSGTDFRFVNSLSNPIKIQASAAETSVTVNILGTKIPEENFTITIDPKITEQNAAYRKTVTTVTKSLNGKVLETRQFNSKYNLSKN